MLQEDEAGPDGEFKLVEQKEPNKSSRTRHQQRRKLKNQKKQPLLHSEVMNFMKLGFGRFSVNENRTSRSSRPLEGAHAPLSCFAHRQLPYKQQKKKTHFRGGLLWILVQINSAYV